MLAKKICMLGTSAVGKTSLVRRFVHGIFSDRYLTTIGVRIDRKDVTVGDTVVQLLLWDLEGEDRFQGLSRRYLRGAAGYLLVVDGTRADTLSTARALHRKALDTLGPVPCVVVLNKRDLAEAWEVGRADLEGLPSGPVLETSAKTGMGVEAIFETMARALLKS